VGVGNEELDPALASAITGDAALCHYRLLSFDAVHVRARISFTFDGTVRFTSSKSRWARSRIAIRGVEGLVNVPVLVKNSR
jgi:hypothetical protein